MEFSEAHLAAFRQYAAKGHRLDGLSPAQLRALDEDPNFGHELAAHRRRMADDEAAARTAAPMPAPATTPPKPRIKDLGTTAEQLVNEADEAIRAAVEGDRTKFAALLEKYEACRDWPAVERVLSRALHLIALEANGTRKSQIAALEERIVALEARPVGGGAKYAGTYRPETRYACGELVTRSGGLWLAQRDSIAETPGSSTAWLLIVKRGDA